MSDIDPKHKESILAVMSEFSTSDGIVDPIKIAIRVYQGNKTVYALKHVQYPGYIKLVSCYTDPLDASFDSSCL